LSPKSFGQNLYQNAKDEFAATYPTATPFASASRLIGDAQEVVEQFSPEEYDGGVGYRPASYVGVGAQNMDVQAQSAPRNFMAYSGGGQFGSTARVYDSILMSPVSTWSRDLASRYS
jgi:hypothetical protein